MKLSILFQVVALAVFSTFGLARHVTVSSSPVATIAKVDKLNKRGAIAKFADISKTKPDSLVAEGSTTIDARTRGFACIIGGALAHLTLGTIYCWANFMSYSPPHLRFYDGLEHKGVQPDALIVIPMTIIAQCFAVPLGMVFVG